MALEINFGLEVKGILVNVVWKVAVLLYSPAHKTHLDFFIRNFRNKLWMYFNFSNLLEENRIVTYQN